MRKILLALGAVAALQAIDTRPSKASPWYPWCAQYHDRSGATSCAFTSLAQCRATVSGIGGGCIQNWREPDILVPYARPHRHRHRHYY
jgi:hypothetical protein